MNPFKKIAVKIGITLAEAQSLDKLGVPLQIRNEQRIEEKHIEAGDRAGVDPFQHRRIAGGRFVPDTGVPVFGKNGQPDVSLSQIVNDIVQAGYHLESMSLFLKNEKWTLQMWYSQEEKQFLGTGDLTYFLSEMMNRSRHIHVWDNRTSTGSATINAGRGTPAGPKTTALRMSSGGQFFEESATDDQPSVLEALV